MIWARLVVRGSIWRSFGVSDHDHDAPPPAVRFVDANPPVRHPGGEYSKMFEIEYRGRKIRTPNESLVLEALVELGIDRVEADSMLTEAVFANEVDAETAVCESVGRTFAS